NIIITGGGGSIGSELCRQISQLSPKTIIIIELNEFSLYSIQQEIESSNLSKQVKIIPCLVSILDKPNIEKIFQKYKPDTIFHAAAYKHVKLVEENPITGINNNVFGTLNLAELSLKYKLSNFVLISTDKAVRPSNIMGASKRLSELIIQAFQKKSKNTKYSMVRFGNVLGSSGSVVPKFLNQIKKGGPITLTDPKVTRFFMTINEAVSLVIKSSIITKGGEVFVLNMGDPIRIIDLAKKMIELSGKTIKDQNNSNGDIEIKVIGLSEGEKLYEELLIGNSPIKTKQDKIFIAQEKFIEWKHLKIHLETLKKALCDGNIKLVKNLFINIGTFYKSN
ncbi:polysaccharide biosynthesis protein, partial [Alphaproteobacteria bacterium]|nr:polysaccharide biosynthesis protein [Alphaproteobacteria bacterium]